MRRFPALCLVSGAILVAAGALVTAPSWIPDGPATPDRSSDSEVKQEIGDGVSGPDFSPTAVDYSLDGPRRRDERGKALAFREAPFDQAAAAKIQAARLGDEVALPLFGDASFTADVTGRWDDEHGTRVAARLRGAPDTDRFFISWFPEGVRGLVEIPSRNLAYEIVGIEGGGYAVREWLLTDVICATPGPKGRNALRGIAKPQAAPAATASAASMSAPVPELNSRPGALGVLYLDFDGETVAGTYWAGGATIIAPPARLNASQISEAWERVARDYEYFDVNVTTSRAVYDNAPANRRSHCIITSNDAAAPGGGGVALLNSFTTFNNSDKICWSFIDTDPKFCAEVASHELGHTLALSHDGRSAGGGQPREEYYEGHGSGATGWAPIMGVGYYQNLTQWNRGEYTRANNPEDDLAIMSDPSRIPLLADDHGSTRPTAVAVAGDRVDGRIETRTDFDYFSVSLPAGTHTIHLNPSPYANVDLELRVENGGGTNLSTANPADFLNASATFNLGAPQVVYLRVDGIGKTPTNPTGYSDYASLGRYSLTGFGDQMQPPSAPAGVAAQVLSGTVVRLTWAANPSATSYQIFRGGVLIGTVSGTTFLDQGAIPSTSYSYAVVAVNAYGNSPASAPIATTTAGADQFIMDGAPDFSGYLLSNPGMTIYAAVRGTKLYVATWSSGNNSSGAGNDHFIFVSDTLLSSATTPAPWSKLGFHAIPSGKPFLAAESSNAFAGWNNSIGPTVLFKAADSSGVLEGVIDLAAQFGSVPAEIYVAAVAYQTDNANIAVPNNGRISSQAPAGNGNNNLDPAEFLRIPTRSVADLRQNGIYDVLAPDRAFRPELSGPPGAPIVSWPSVPGRIYEVRRMPDLAAGSWTNLTPAGLTAGTAQWEMSFTNNGAPSSDRLFYRVMVR